MRKVVGLRYYGISGVGYVWEGNIARLGVALLGVIWGPQRTTVAVVR